MAIEDSVSASEVYSNPKLSAASFVLFHGLPWCPPCIAVDPILMARFSEPDASQLYTQSVGSREEWKLPAQSPWREEPYSVKGVPTLIKLVDGKEVGRAVGTDIVAEGKLEAFLKD